MKEILHSFSYGVAVGAVVIGVSACSPTVHKRGNILEEFQISQIQEGVSTRQNVLKTFGSPTTTGPFDENSWYYLGQVTEKHGVFDPEVDEETIVKVTFDEAGVVQSVENLSTERLEFPLVDRETPTSGNEVTALQQLIGNIGKFNPAGSTLGE